MALLSQCERKRGNMGTSTYINLVEGVLVESTLFKAIAIIFILIGSLFTVYQCFSFVRPDVPLYFSSAFAIGITFALALGLLMHKFKEGKILIAGSCRQSR